MVHNINPSLLYLWDKRTLYIGPLFETLDLSQGAAALVVALDKPITFQTKEQLEPIECWSLLLPAGMSVRVETHNAIIVNCNLDPLGVDYSSLSRLMQKHENGIGYQLFCEDEFIADFWEMYRSQLESKPAYEYIEHLLTKNNQACMDCYDTDPRVVEVIKLIKQTIGDNLSLDDLALAVNLSASRLVQLFKQQTGVPIRRYRLWHRLYVTAILVGQGENLTEAAVAAGFNDSSHYCHTFRSMLGFTPSFLLAQPNKLRIIIPDETN
ncbi:helix-turn-helix transcriptional regulator [Alkalimarinus alittae]|uniref:AraC family transcriptional regulator n=1 Tax=Alkalimarinus alittae TaxID=2961619 RepID=A0ABY6MXE1_9ALTE|nr:AraC family transcriptional regulator [Alkalimarinus alittae]UZE94498.1 AraC family transcriptional regulator [Alkalimarinus alittae]